jgi:hypothetical protein
MAINPTLSNTIIERLNGALQSRTDRMSCQSDAAGSPHRRAPANAWRARRDSEDEPLGSFEFATLRERPIKIGAPVIEHITRIAD